MLEIFGITYPIFSQLFYLFYGAFIFSTILVIVMENRSPVRTMAWILVLLFLPIIGLLLYLFLGQNTRKRRMISRKGIIRLNKSAAREYEAQNETHVDEQWAKVADFFMRVNQSYPLDGNKISVYTSGYDFVHALLKAIYSARHHIHLQSYIFSNDSVGKLVRDALIDRARQGIKVRVIYDDVGSWKTPKSFFEEMLFAGIEVEGFLKVRFPMFTSKVNYRNHRKIIIIDGQIGFIGGMNIANRYLTGINGGIWKDTHVQLDGKSVYSLQARFLTDWFYTNHTMLTSSDYYPPLESKGSTITQIVTSDPIGEWRDMMQGLVMMIANTKRYLYLQTPYLLPTQHILVALQSAALSGVDVRIMIPKVNDSLLIQKASMSYLDDLLSAGVKIYLYRRGFIHSKMFIADDSLSSVGSTNMDFRSFEHNFESNAFFYDKDLAMELKKVFLDDQKDCMLLTRTLWKRRRWHHKVAESILRLFAPLL